MDIVGESDTLCVHEYSYRSMHRMLIHTALTLRSIYWRSANPVIRRRQCGSRPLLIIGHGRSGTSWVGSVFAKAAGVLYYMEPCNPTVNRIGNFGSWFTYLRPGDRDEVFEHIYDRAFSGLLIPGCRWGWKRHFARMFGDYRVVVKEVASIMAFDWVADRYDPDALIIIRHPCGVVSSELEKRTDASRQKRSLLEQTNLLRALDSRHISLLRDVNTPLEIFAATWGLRHLILHRALETHTETPVVSYESLCGDPKGTFASLFDRFGFELSDDVLRHIALSTTTAVPGTYSTRRNTAEQINKWKRRLKSGEIDRIRRLVEMFDLPYYANDIDWEC